MTDARGNGHTKKSLPASTVSLRTTNREKRAPYEHHSSGAQPVAPRMSFPAALIANL